jgi:acyl dehydratase
MTRITPDTSIGQEFSGKPKKQAMERIWAFSGGTFRTLGWPLKNIHTDYEAAEKMGLSTVYVSATQYLGYIAELMIDLFGEKWLSSGTTDNLKFTQPVTEGDTIVVKARVRSKEQDGDLTKVCLDIWCENQSGDSVLIGTATGFTGS